MDSSCGCTAFDSKDKKIRSGIADSADFRCDFMQWNFEKSKL